MRKNVPALVAIMTLAVMFIAGCSGKKDTAPADNDTMNDSIVKDTAEEELDTLEQLIAQTPMPKAADELFDDFIFNYAANKEVQKGRTHFPLLVYNTDESVDTIHNDEWDMEHFFMHQGFYTQIFDNDKQMNVTKDTKVSNVTIEKINLSTNVSKQYVFERIDSKWQLKCIRNISIDNSPNASFLKFYHKFASSTEFQQASLASDMVFKGPDPKTDYESNITTKVSPEEWPDYSLEELPTEEIYNIIYGQHYGDGNKKIFMLKGIANGLETRLDFKRVGDEWKLYKLTI